MLLLHRDGATSALLKAALETDGVQVITVGGGEAALEILNTTAIQLAVLDAATPGISGLDVLKRIRNTPLLAHLPVIVIAEGNEIERIIALELGADDCLLAPCNPRELRLRLRALLKRHCNLPPVSVLRVGDFAFDALAHEVRVGGQLVPLTATEFRLLALLVRKRGAVVQRHELIGELSRTGSHQVSYRTINTHMRRLVEKLGHEGARIQNIRGIGYRFFLGDDVEPSSLAGA